MDAFVNELAVLLSRRGMSVPDLARKSNYSRQYVWEIVAGRKPPSTAAARTLDRALNADGKLAALASQRNEGGDMRRRTLLGGASAIVGALAVPASPLTALDDVLFGPGLVGAEPVPDEQLAAELAAAHREFRQVRYQQLAYRLPTLIRRAEATRDAGHTAANRHVAKVYGLATRLAVKLHDHGCAWSTADRALTAARTAGDPLIIAGAHRTAAVVLRRSGHGTEAQRLLVAAATRLRADTSHRDSKPASLYAGMLATAAYTAALADRRDDAWMLAGEADAAVTSATGGRFGRNDLELYRVGVARALGDYGQAVDYARRVRLDLLRTPERRARYWEDTALAWMGRGRPHQAWESLREAESAAPQEVRYRPWAQQLTRGLLAADVRGEFPGLRAFATRLGAA